MPEAGLATGGPAAGRRHASAPSRSTLRAGCRRRRRRGCPSTPDRAAAAGRPPAASHAARYGASASRVTIQGEIVVAKFFARNGPSGWYSQAWMSRADQSLSRHRPNTCASASAIGMRLAERVAGADEDAQFQLVVQAPARPEHRGLGAGRQDLAERTRELLAATRRSRRRGRDSRSAPTCSWAAAGCRDGTAGRRWWRGGSRCRSRCSRRCAPAARTPRPPAAPGRRRSRSASAEPSRRARDSASRSADHAAGPSAMKAFSAGAPAAAAAPAASPEKMPAAWAAAQVDDGIADRHAAAEGFLRARAAEHAEGQVLDREVAGRLVRRGDPAASAPGRGFRSAGSWAALRVNVKVASAIHESPAMLPSCIQAACLGARLVLDHSSIMSNFTSSSLRIISGVAVLAASSRRWPLGSKK